MYILCSYCRHIKYSTNEEGLKETYCEVLSKRGKNALIAIDLYGDGMVEKVVDLSKFCDSFSWDTNLDKVIKSLAEVWERVTDIENSDYKLLRRPRCE